MKRSIYVLMFGTVLVGTVGFRAEEIAKHRAQDLTAAAQIQPYSPASTDRGPAYLSSVAEADLVSLHMCQGSHKMFASEPRTAAAKELVDAQGAAECVVQLRSALNEVPTTHPAYSDIRAELDWWNGKLRELDPADYHRLNT